MNSNRRAQAHLRAKLPRQVIAANGIDKNVSPAAQSPAFLSIRGEFNGEAEKVKQIFTSTATDLGRDRYFQGAGLVDRMRAIQSA